MQNTKKTSIFRIVLMLGTIIAVVLVLILFQYFLDADWLLWIVIIVIVAAIVLQRTKKRKTIEKYKNPAETE